MKVFPKSKFNPDQCLPPHMIVPNVDDCLYRIGLCMTSVRERPIRRPLDHPFCAFIVCTIYLVTKVVTCSLGDDNWTIFLLLGSTGYLIGIRQHFDMLFILASILALSSQLIYYYNYKMGITPTFLRLFQMMSGLVPPKAIGLTDERFVFKLTKRTHKLCQLIQINNDYIIPTIANVFTLWIYFYKTKPLDVDRKSVV